MFDFLDSNLEVLWRLVEALKVSRHEELLHLHLGAGRFHLLIAIQKEMLFRNRHLVARFRKLNIVDPASAGNTQDALCEFMML